MAHCALGGRLLNARLERVGAYCCNPTGNCRNISVHQRPSASGSVDALPALAHGRRGSRSTKAVCITRRRSAAAHARRSRSLDRRAASVDAGEHEGVAYRVRLYQVDAHAHKLLQTGFGAEESREPHR